MASASSKGTLAEELRALRQLIRAHRLQHHRAPYFRRVVECHKLGVEAATAPADDAAEVRRAVVLQPVRAEELAEGAQLLGQRAAGGAQFVRRRAAREDGLHR